MSKDQVAVSASISKLQSMEVDVIIVYRSEQGNLTDLAEHLKKLISTVVNTVVTGDFNLCYVSNRNNKVTKNLENNGFSQHMNEPTHMKGRTTFTSDQAVNLFRFLPSTDTHLTTPTMMQSARQFQFLKLSFDYDGHQAEAVTRLLLWNENTTHGLQLFNRYPCIMNKNAVYL